MARFNYVEGGGNVENKIQEIRENLKKSGLTAKQALEVLEKCKSEILHDMPINENLKSKLTW